ncbi:DUF6783 domain-containing protein [Blautia sp. HCP3S3_G3]|uniref:DUF6783 domain-containing protein n=1 Tax=Blautia sp. HCP3S3_G3 TaxID=3438913 RepID=UPI003F8A2B4C
MSVSGGSASNHKFPANCDAHLSESNFQTRSTASKSCCKWKTFQKETVPFYSSFCFQCAWQRMFLTGGYELLTGISFLSQIWVRRSVQCQVYGIPEYPRKTA